MLIISSPDGASYFDLFQSFPFLHRILMMQQFGRASFVSMARDEEVIRKCRFTKRTGKPRRKVLRNPSDHFPASFPYVNARTVFAFKEVNTAFLIFRDHVFGGGEDVFQSTEVVKRGFQTKGAEGMTNLTRKLSKKGESNPFKFPIMTGGSRKRSGIIKLNPQHLFPDHPFQIKGDKIDFSQML